MQMTKMSQIVHNYLGYYSVKVLAAIIILILGYFVVKLIRDFICKLMEKSKAEATLVHFTGNFVFALGMVFVILAVLSKLGVETTSFIAVIGAAGLAIGLALQGSLSNFAAGIILIIFRPIRVGDFIDAGGAMGTVEDLGIFTTIMKSPDNKTVFVPNSVITSGVIMNYSMKDMRRVDLIFGVSYSDNLKKVREVITEVLLEDARILKEPAFTIGVLSLGDSSVNFAVRPWVKTSDYWPVLFSLNEKIKCRFDEQGISIPFPQRDVHLIETKK